MQVRAAGAFGQYSSMNAELLKVTCHGPPRCVPETWNWQICHSRPNVRQVNVRSQKLMSFRKLDAN